MTLLMNLAQQHSRPLFGMIVAAVVAFGCVENSAGEPRRPAAVPEQATWVGGPDGGVFVVLQAPKGASSAAYSGTVYHADGSVWYSGSFVLQPAGAKPIDLLDKRQLSGWDGTKLLVEGGRALVATADKRTK